MYLCDSRSCGVFHSTSAATYPPASSSSLSLANYSEGPGTIQSNCNSRVSVKFESCHSPVLKQRRGLTVPSRQRACHYLALPNSPLTRLDGGLCSAKPVSSPAALWDAAPVRLKRATLWKVCFQQFAREISDLTALSEVRWDDFMVHKNHRIHLVLHPTPWYNGWLALTEGACRVGGCKWCNIKCNSFKFTHGILPLSHCGMRHFNFVMSPLMPHLLELGRYYVQRLGRVRKCIKGVAGSPYCMCWNVPWLAIGVGHHDLRQKKGWVRLDSHRKGKEQWETRWLRIDKSYSSSTLKTNICVSTDGNIGWRSR